MEGRTTDENINSARDRKKKSRLTLHPTISQIEIRYDPTEPLNAEEWSKFEQNRSIMELEALGAEIWSGIDAQDYVNKERASWDYKEESK